MRMASGMGSLHGLAAWAAAPALLLKQAADADAGSAKSQICG
jgi:hypothetical protein